MSKPNDPHAPISATTLSHISTDPSRKRLFFMSMMAALVGIAGGFAAYGLYELIRLISNAVFYTNSR